MLDLPKGLGDAIIGGGEYVAFKALGGIDPEFDKRFAEGANALRAKMLSGLSNMNMLQIKR